MGLGHLDAVVDHRDGGEDVFDIGSPGGFPPSIGQERTNAQLGDGDRGDGDVVVVFDDDYQTSCPDTRFSTA